MADDDDDDEDAAEDVGNEIDAVVADVDGAAARTGFGLEFGDGFGLLFNIFFLAGLGDLCCMGVVNAV